MSTGAKVFNFVMFQLCWMACVWGAARNLWWLGVGAVAIFALIEIARAPRPGRELALIGVIAVVGLAIDSAYLWFGLIEYASQLPPAPIAPIWIVAMWISFGLTLNRSLVWLLPHRALGALLGLVGGPLAYWIAIEAWDAGRFMTDTWLALAVIAVAWTLATPLLLELTARITPRAAEQGTVA